MTVSRAFSDPERVSEPLRLRILQRAEQYSYRPNRIASGMIKGKSYLIGVLNYTSGVKYFRDINCGIAHELLKHGYMPVIMELGYGDSLELIRKMADYRVDGMIMMNVTSILRKEERKEFDLHNIPSVCIDSISERFDCAVQSDEIQGGELAAEFLLKHGGTRFAYFGLECELKRNRTDSKRGHRDKSFTDYLKERNISVRRLSIADDLDHVFSKPDHPDAILLQNDNLASEYIYPLCRKYGLKIPDDVQVIGFSDMDCCVHLEPKLTTIRQDGITMGHRAAQLLLDLIRNPKKKRQAVIMPVSLLERESTKQI